MKKLFTIIKRLFTNKCDKPLHNDLETDYDWINDSGYSDVFHNEYCDTPCGEPLHNHHDGCPVCDMPH